MTGQSSPSPETGRKRNEYVLASMPHGCAREHEPGRVCIRPDGHLPDTGWHQHGDHGPVHREPTEPILHHDCYTQPMLPQPVLVLPLDGLREQIARAIYGFEVGPFGPNSVEIFAKGGTVHLNGSEADYIADAVLALLAGFAAGQETT